MGVGGLIVSLPCDPSMILPSIKALREASDKYKEGLLSKRRAAQKKYNLPVTPEGLGHSQRLVFAPMSSLISVPGREVEAIANQN